MVYKIYPSFFRKNTKFKIQNDKQLRVGRDERAKVKTER